MIVTQDRSNDGGDKWIPFILGKKNNNAPSATFIASQTEEMLSLQYKHIQNCSVLIAFKHAKTGRWLASQPSLNEVQLIDEIHTSDDALKCMWIAKCVGNCRTDVELSVTIAAATPILAAVVAMAAVYVAPFANIVAGIFVVVLGIVLLGWLTLSMYNGDNIKAGRVETNFQCAVNDLNKCLLNGTYQPMWHRYGQMCMHLSQSDIANC